MNITLIVFVVLYLLGTLGIGVWYGSRIKGTADFAVAGRSLPLIMVITTTFATWFGAETVMGIPAKFVQAAGADRRRPFGAGMCLILVGLFFAAKLYKPEPADHRRLLPPALRQGRRGLLLGGHHPQLPGLGGGADHGPGPGVLGADQWRHVETAAGMIVGSRWRCSIYVVIGGFLAVAWTDFIQMIVLVVGLCPSSPCSRPIWPVAPVWCWTWRTTRLGKFCPSPASPTWRCSSARR